MSHTNGDSKTGKSILNYDILGNDPQNNKSNYQILTGPDVNGQILIGKELDYVIEGVEDGELSEDGQLTKNNGEVIENFASKKEFKQLVESANIRNQIKEQSSNEQQESNKQQTR